ncbi:hypothetical protein TNIN_198401 [Trichonephila inaurata madagascariensis]|uniref:C2H2-type domain-containing protein n=1 Tax=Trichonephila inaurata madagascariensis TaxID=2747483 RepID=A0A8X6J924_9ARAC|nr:hypothetical protein TNIN_198401 [Trichonephila inaurata madagascariensis]
MALRRHVLRHANSKEKSKALQAICKLADQAATPASGKHSDEYDPLQEKIRSLFPTEFASPSGSEQSSPSPQRTTIYKSSPPTTQTTQPPPEPSVLSALRKEWADTGPPKIRAFPMNYAAKTKKNLFKCRKCPLAFYTAAKFEEHQSEEQELESLLEVDYSTTLENAENTSEPSKPKNKKKKKKPKRNNRNNRTIEENSDPPLTKTRGKCPSYTNEIVVDMNTVVDSSERSEAAIQVKEKKGRISELPFFCEVCGMRFASLDLCTDNLQRLLSVSECRLLQPDGVRL